MTAREAKSKLATKREELKVSLAKHAAEVKNLVDMTYPDLEGVHSRSIGLNSF